MTDEHRTLLRLLSVAMGNARHLPVADCQWEEVASLSFGQGVAAIAFDGLQNLYTTSPETKALMDSPDWRELKYKWIGQALSCEKRYARYERAVGRLAGCCHQLGLKMLVLKGYGCSLNYPVPGHRPTGDIDIYLFGQKECLDRWAEHILGEKVARRNEHHSVFRFEGFTVENHQTILDVKAHKSCACLEELLEKLARDSEAHPHIPGLYLPSVAFNSVHLLRHAANDFATVRTTLRHLLDWSTFVSGQRVDWAFLHDVARRSNMHLFLDAVNGICVDYLGYPPQQFPVLECRSRLRDKVLNEILTNEDRPDAAPCGLSWWRKWGYGLAKSRRLWKNRWKHDMVYNESLWESFVWKSRNRLNNL